MCFSVYILVSMLYKNFTEDEPEQILTPVVSMKYRYHNIDHIKIHLIIEVLHIIS